MQKIKSCCNFVYENAKSIFTAGAAICGAAAIATYLTPQGKTHASYRAILNTAPQIFLGLATLFGTLAATSDKQLGKLKRTVILLPSILGTALFLDQHLGNMRRDSHAAYLLKNSADKLIEEGKMEKGDRLLSCFCTSCDIEWEDRDMLSAFPLPEKAPVGHKFLTELRKNGDETYNMIIGFIKMGAKSAKTK
jgi:hypothetical protein